MTEQTTTPENNKSDIFSVFNYATDEKHAFIYADLFVGSAALWIPLVLGIMFYTKTSIYYELVKLLDSGSGYTFSLAFLAAESSYIYLQRRKKQLNDLRDEFAPNIWLWCQMTLGGGIVLTVAHYSYQILVPNNTNLLLNILQSLFFIWTIYLGNILFCLKNIEKLPGELDKYRKKEKEKAKNLGEKAKQEITF